jgi:acetyl-CoA acetyltransferase
MTGTAVVGIGMTRPMPHQDVLSGLELAASAFVEALDDAGLERSQIDGLVVQHGQPGGGDYDEFAQFMDLDVTYSYQLWPHGRLTGSAIALASMMVSSGVAQRVACVTGFRAGATIGGSKGFGFHEEVRTLHGGGPHGEQPFVGLTAPIGQAAMALQTYVLDYGVDRNRLYGVVAAERAAAMKNPLALRQRPISREEYESQDYVVEPLRRADCSANSEAGSCIIVSAADSSNDRAISVAGYVGVPSGRHEFIWSRPGLGLWLQGWRPDVEPDLRIYDRTGIKRDDVDLLYTYDSFSPLVWFALERYGFCAPGAAADFVDDAGIGLDGGLPVNTSGGMLYEGSRAGWGHLIEAVRQLRGEAGERQVKSARVAQWGACYGESVMFAA